MTTYFVATRARYVLVDAENETEARELGRTSLYELYADLRERLGREVPIEIHTVRPATNDEIELMRWHRALAIRELVRNSCRCQRLTPASAIKGRKRARYGAQM